MIQPATDSLACGFSHHPRPGKLYNHLALWHGGATADSGFPLSTGLSPGPRGQFPGAPAPSPLWHLTAPEAPTPARLSLLLLGEKRSPRLGALFQPPNIHLLPPSLPQLSLPGTRVEGPPPHYGTCWKLQMPSPCPSWTISLPLFWVLPLTFQRTFISPSLKEGNSKLPAGPQPQPFLSLSLRTSGMGTRALPQLSLLHLPSWLDTHQGRSSQTAPAKTRVLLVTPLKGHCLLIQEGSLLQLTA